MMKKLFLFCLFFSFFCSSLQASEETTPPPSELSTIHTYGGGKFFKTIFDAVHILVFDGATDGFGKSYGGLLAIALIVGTFSAYILALGQESFRPIFKRWLPSFVIIFSVFSLRSDVWIKDHLVAKSASPNESVVYRVEGVPLVLAKSAALLSWLSYRVTKEFEKAAHGIKDEIYNWTGHIFAGETLFRSGQVQISDANLDQNLKNFCYDCIANDLSLINPPYTRQDLFEADDLLDFLSKNTNPWYSFSYIDDNGKETLERCHTGIEKIKNKIRGIGTKKDIPFLSSFMKKNKDTAIKGAIYGNIGNPAGLLLKNSENALLSQKKFFEQHYLIDSINTHTNPPDFASFRATQIQRANQKTIGSLAVQYIVYTRIVLEGLAYISFPIIVIFALASVGFRIVIHWFQLLVWISLWPPFFVIAKFLLQILWETRLEKTFGTSSVSFNMFSSFGLADLYASMEGVAFGMLATIGTLTFFLMKGGGHMMASLAGSLNAPAHAAAAQASGEATSGNYSFGNINYGNRSFSKMSGIHWDTNSSLSQGRTTHSDGFNSLSTNDRGDVLVNKGISSTGADLRLNQSMGNRLQEGLSLSTNKVDSIEKGLQQAQTDTIASGENFVKALDNNKGWSDSLQGGQQQQAMEAYDEVKAHMENYRETDGHSKNLTAEGGIDFSFGLKVGAKGAITQSWGKEHGESAEASERFSSNVQKLSQIISNANMANNFSELQKSAQDFNHNMSNVASLTEQHRSAVSEQEAATNAVDQWKTMSADGGINLNNEYVDYLKKNNNNDMGIVNGILDNTMENKEQMGEFLDFYEQRIKDQYQDNQAIANEMHEENKQNIPEQPNDFSSPEYAPITNRVNAVNDSLGEGGENVLKTINQKGENLRDDFGDHKEDVEGVIYAAEANSQGTLDAENSQAKKADEMIKNRNLDPGGKKQTAAALEVMKENQGIVDQLRGQKTKAEPSIGSEAWFQQQIAIQKQQVEEYNKKRGEKYPQKPE
ncbi:MAG: conjugal transfer protein TraG N-terminal domain-containing protein [Chlamydiota bacterium]